MSELRFPIDGSFRIGYGFGPRGNIGVEGASTNHEGIDIVRPHEGLPVGTPVYAILDGKVIFAGNSHGGAGYTTLTEHAYKGDRYRVRSNHFSKWSVTTGQTIKQGQVLGLSGGMPKTPGAGSSGGPHYHCGIYKLTGGTWKPIDPGPFFGLGSTRGIGSTRPGVVFPAFAGGGSKPFVPDSPAKDEEEEDDMPKNSGVVYNRKNTDGTTSVVYLLFNTGSGWWHEFSNGPGKGAAGGGYVNPIAQSLDTPSWATITESHAGVIKRGLERVLSPNTTISGSLSVDVDA